MSNVGRHDRDQSGAGNLGRAIDGHFEFSLNHLINFYPSCDRADTKEQPPATEIGESSLRQLRNVQRCTLPEPSPLSSAFTSSTVERLKSPCWECFRQLVATANSSAS